MEVFIKAGLDDGYTSLEDIQNDVTNDYWIIGTYKASQALAAFDSDDGLTNKQIQAIKKLNY